jgi:murein DD-endopeptidase MepM/ murein hydrolase activator NlpD
MANAFTSVPANRVKTVRLLDIESKLPSERISSLMKFALVKNLLLAGSMMALFVSPAVGAATSPIEVRFCPANEVRTYPLESQRGLQSLLLHNAAVINHGQPAISVTAIEVELLQAGQVLDMKKLDAKAIQFFVERGAKAQAAGIFKQVAFQFCGTDLIGPSIKLAGPKLEKDQALLITSQIFAFRGARDTLRVRVHGDVGGKAIEITNTLPIKSEFAKNTYIFPLRGVSYVGVAASFHTPHRWVIPEEFGLDIAKLGDSGLSHKGTGTRFEDYYGYGADILAAADGRVIEVATDQSEDPAAMQRPDETQEAYFARLQKEQAERLEKDSIVGNFVLIDHGQSEFAFYAHLKPGSVRVKTGDQVKAGDVIGKLGSSGNSTEPHLHFQLCNKPGLGGSGIPVNFSNVTILWADLPRPLQSGDIVIAK